MIRLGTRRSPLAQAQANRVVSLLPPGSAQTVLLQSHGDLDRISPLHLMERPGAFTHLLTDAILDGRIDAAVHSLKDLPLDAPDEAPIVAVLSRDNPADALVVRKDAVDESRPLGLAANSRVGTSAPRRHSQIQDADPTLIPVDVRGNIGTRLLHLAHGAVEGLLMAAAAFDRMEIRLPPGIVRRPLDPTRFPGCPGQGAIAVQARRGSEAAALLSGLDNVPTRISTQAERAVLRALGGGCGLPLGVRVRPAGGTWKAFATLKSQDGNGTKHFVRVSRTDRDLANLVENLVRILKRPPEPIQEPVPPTMRTVAITLDEERLPDYSLALRAAGWKTSAWRLTSKESTGAPLPEEWATAAWIAVASPHAARYAVEVSSALKRPVRMAALGPATAQSLRKEGLPVHTVSRQGTGASLADAIAAFPGPPGPVLVPQAEEPTGSLLEGLQGHGFSPMAWSAYRTMPCNPILALDPPPQAVVFTSPSAIRAFVAAGCPLPSWVRFVAFGPTTAEAMVNAGIPVDSTCSQPTPAGVCEALL